MQYLVGLALIAAGYGLTQSSLQNAADGAGYVYYGLMLAGAITVIRAWVGV